MYNENKAEKDPPFAAAIKKGTNGAEYGQAPLSVIAAFKDNPELWALVLEKLGGKVDDVDAECTLTDHQNNALDWVIYNNNYAFYDQIKNKASDLEPCTMYDLWKASSTKQPSNSRKPGRASQPSTNWLRTLSRSALIAQSGLTLLVALNKAAGFGLLPSILSPTHISASSLIMLATALHHVVYFTDEVGRGNKREGFAFIAKVGLGLYLPACIAEMYSAQIHQTATVGIKLLAPSFISNSAALGGLLAGVLSNPIFLSSCVYMLQSIVIGAYKYRTADYTSLRDKILGEAGLPVKGAVDVWRG